MRTRIERLFRIIEMIGVLALLLAGLPDWGALVVVALTFLLCVYIFETVVEEMTLLMGASPKSEGGRPLGGIGRMMIGLVVALAESATVIAIMYLATRLRDVLIGAG